MRACFAAGLIVLHVTDVLAAPPPIYPANATCEQWITGNDGVAADKRDRQDTAYNFWLAGFFDAAAVTRGYSAPEMLERGAFIGDLGKFCQAFPSETLARAATLVLMRMRNK